MVPDLKDKRILYELDLDARAPISYIAKKVRLKKNTVRYRIERLEKDGYIKGYYAVIDNSKLGYIGIRVYFKFSDTNIDKETEILSYLKTRQHIHVLNYNDGFYDATIIAWVKNIYEFDLLWTQFKEKYRQYVQRENIALFTKIYHYPRKYLIGEKRSYDEMPLIVGGSNIIKHDDTDMKILSLISGNARMSILEISNRLELATRTVALRIQSMEKTKIIQGYRPLLNIEKLGFKYYKLNFMLHNLSNIKALTEFCHNNMYVTYIDMTISSNDFEIDVEVPSEKELIKLISEIKDKFGNIKDYEEFTVKEYVKLLYFPSQT
jgi:Lrp/AsnC family transcriptional regulator, leucine-responsive regulatory protein